jgi:hypothetical protein
MQTTTLGYEILNLTIESIDGKNGIDIRFIFDEINIFENVMLPCMSGNIVIHDAIGLSTKLNFDGSEYIRINITKDDKTLGGEFDMNFDRRFVIYKLSNRKEVNQNSEIYTLHFVSDEFILSQQKKVRKNYKDTHDKMIMSILKEYLNLKFETPQIGSIFPTSGVHELNIPNLSPFDAINYVTKRAIGPSGRPDFLFWQTPIGYNFLPLSEILRFGAPHTITFGAKNLPVQTKEKQFFSELYGARDLKIISQYNYSENIQAGVYAGKFIGFDTITRKIKTHNLSYSNVYNMEPNHANEYPHNNKILNKEYNTADTMYDSRVTLYPFQTSRANNSYLLNNDVQATQNIDDTEKYILQRKMILSNLLQRKLNISMPGNFQYTAGSMIELLVPKRNNIDKDEYSDGDKTLSGKYLITGLRHVIKFDKHETLLEVVTDSTNYGAR